MRLTARMQAATTERQLVAIRVAEATTVRQVEAEATTRRVKEGEGEA